MMQAAGLGVRTQWADGEDEEEWDDVVEELGNPWAMEPAQGVC